MMTPNNNGQVPIGAEHDKARNVKSSVWKKLKLVGFNAQGTIQKLFELMQQKKIMTVTSLSCKRLISPPGLRKTS
eukprot:4401214-Pleurochrysis_carterae.AAC.1